MNVYTFEEVAEMFKMKSKSLRNLAAQGKLNTIKIFGARRITQEEIDRLLKEKGEK